MVAIPQLPTNPYWRSELIRVAHVREKCAGSNYSVRKVANRQQLINTNTMLGARGRPAVMTNLDISVIVKGVNIAITINDIFTSAGQQQTKPSTTFIKAQTASKTRSGAVFCASTINQSRRTPPAEGHKKHAHGPRTGREKLPISPESRQVMAAPCA
ncbi:hypothetical protein EVAR_95681_1 [Eumeta japonica]|uniref:Uncharacterized protein n=1 Tax=Eumeta variegata TaxID=151549 RepID=A0A4C1VK72_EUMVA|nr:hypothetical protein EVAR_95681_1 [Eumeta japonica]